MFPYFTKKNLRASDHRYNPLCPGEGVVVEENIIFSDVGIVHEEHQVTCCHFLLLLMTEINKNV